MTYIKIEGHNMKRIFAAILLIIPVIFSGCTNMQSSYTSNGVVVQNFEFQPSTLYDVNKAYLKLSLKNEGRYLSKNIYVDIYGLGNDWGIIDVQGTKKIRLEDASRFDIDANFRIKKEYEIADSNVIISGDVYINNIENIFKGESPEIGIDNLDVFIKRDDISIYIQDLQKLLDVAYKNNYNKVADLKLSEVYEKAPKIPPVFIDYLAPAIPDQNFPGESIDLYWVVKPPSDLPANTELIKDVHARICFQTEQTLATQIQFVNFNELLNENIKRSKETKVLNGYVRTTIEYDSPVIMEEDKPTELIFRITFENNGPGVITQEPCKEVIGSEITEDGNVKDVERKDYTNKVNQIKFQIKGSNCEIKNDAIYVPAHKSASFIVYCRSKTPNMPKYTQDLDIKIIYSYYYDVSTQVKIIGTKKEG